MHATPRRRAESDPSLAIAKPPWFTRTASIQQQRKPLATAAISEPLKPRDLHREFVYKHGSKLHAFATEDAPWPISFDNDVLELRVLLFRGVMIVLIDDPFSQMRT
jgi:hypothetical protein